MYDPVSRDNLLVSLIESYHSLASYLSYAYTSEIDTRVIVSVCLTVGTSHDKADHTCAYIALYSTHHT